ncbi:hypothetical protein Hanom_Chr03g00234871 [Helianthus anomalus]
MADTQLRQSWQRRRHSRRRQWWCSGDCRRLEQKGERDISEREKETRRWERDRRVRAAPPSTATMAVVSVLFSTMTEMMMLFVAADDVQA